MSSVLDEGLALFAGLNVIPKRSFLTEYSCRIDPDCYPKLTRLWFDAMTELGLRHGTSFDLDFHTIPLHGADALVEKHYVSKRSRRQKGLLAFLAQDASTRVFCYADSQLRQDRNGGDAGLQTMRGMRGHRGAPCGAGSAHVYRSAGISRSIIKVIGERMISAKYSAGRSCMKNAI